MNDYSTVLAILAIITLVSTAIGIAAKVMYEIEEDIKNDL